MKHELAERALKHFTLNDKGFQQVHPDAPEWVDDMCREAHGGMLPDNWKFEFVVDALRLLVDSEDWESIDVEEDCYTHDLLQWLASNLRRVEICNDAVGEFGIDPTEGLLVQIAAGQRHERWTVLNSVRDFLERLAEETAKEET